MNFEQPQKPRNPEEVILEEERDNYGKHAEKASNVNFLGEGTTQKEAMINDAEAEDEYREFLKEGKKNESEYRILVDFDIKRTRSGGVQAGFVEDIVEGMVKGNQAKVSRRQIISPNEFVVGDNIDIKISGKGITYKVTKNGEEMSDLSYDDRKTNFVNLTDIAEKRKEILKKVNLLQAQKAGWK
ncbi:MAG: hypothetical protein AAB628_02615 [Patescibacteria group bacterium]